jgi:hypothetical protein
VDNPPSSLPGLSNAELEAGSDLVARVEVAAIDWAKDKTSPHVATLKLLTLLKGEPHYRHPHLAKLRLDRTIDVKMRRIKRDEKGHPLPGEWSDGYRVGDRVITHLVWDEVAGSYRTLSWNAVWQTPD